MAQTNRREMQHLVKKCNRAYDRISFNEQYPAVLAEQLDARNARRMRILENKAKERLLPLELASVPAAQANRWLIDREMAAAKEAQAMKRRAIQQTYLRAVEKGGQTAASAARDKRLAALDKALADRLTALEAKYPPDSDMQPAAGAAARYSAAEKKEAAALEAERARLAAEKDAKLKKVMSGTQAKNRKLRAGFDSYMKKLDKYSKITEEEFGQDTLLRIQNLKMYFSGVKAVDDISFDIRKGEIFALIGPNGAGKTTIFNCVTQFYKPTAGSVYYRNRFGKIVNLTDYKTHDVIKCGISRTFQNLEMVLGLTVLENMLVGVHSQYQSNLFDQFLHTGRLKQEEAVNRALAEDILSRLGLSEYKNMYPQGLPYGVLKKIELGRTLMTNPQLIILDEPAAGLNDTETRELAETIRQIRDDFKCTIFLVEHDMNLVMSICDTICVASFGKRLAIGTPEEIQNNPQVQEAYLGVEEGEGA